MSATAHNFIDRTGVRSGDLIIVARHGRTSSRAIQWKAQCRRRRLDGSICKNIRVITSVQIDEVFACAPCSRVRLGVGLEGKSRKYEWTELQDETIRTIWTRRKGNGATSRDIPTAAEYARRVGVPKHAVVARAKQLGLTQPKKEKPWTEKEKALIKRLSWMTAYMIYKEFKRRGFKRSLTAVRLKYKRLRLYAQREWYNARDLSEALGHDSHTVAKWIADGHLKAQRREFDVPESSTANRHYEYVVTHEALREFMFRHHDLIDLRRITDQGWFWDVIKHKDLGK